MKAPSEWGFSNLLEMLRFYAESYCLLTAHLQAAGIQTTISGTLEADNLTNGIVETLITRLKAMKLESDKIGLEATADLISVTLDRWESYGDKDALRQFCSQLINCLNSELKRRVCFILPRESQTLYSSPLAGWERIVEVFPDIRDDVEEMNKCKAFGRDVASVFHALLVVEHGLIQLGIAMKVTDPKQGWDATCKTLEKVLKDGRAVAPKHIQKHFAFYELVNKDIQSMKMAWRNRVSHAANKLVVITSDFKPQVGEKIITACHGFMLLLATEGPRKGKSK